MNTDRVRVLIVDDHPLVLEGIQSCLNTYDHIDVVGVATSGKEAVRLSKKHLPDIVVMDINMPEQSGLDTAELIREQTPDIKLLILSMHDNKEYITSAIMRGACGYVLKDVTTSEIATAIEVIHTGGRYFSSGVSDSLMQVKNLTKQKTLTSREQSVLLALANGNSNKEVAKHLGISVRTVETHRKNIKRKLNISSTAGLTRYAIENGLVS